MDIIHLFSEIFALGGGTRIGAGNRAVVEFITKNFEWDEKNGRCYIVDKCLGRSRTAISGAILILGNGIL